MKDPIIKYKRIIAVLSGLVVCLFISNYVFYNKLNIQSENSLQVVELDNKSVVLDDSLVTSDHGKTTSGTIVLVIDDFGYRNDSVSDGFLKLNVPITCAIIPGHSQSRKFAEKALAEGKEIIIHMPMESSSISSLVIPVLIL